MFYESGQPWETDSYGMDYKSGHGMGKPLTFSLTRTFWFRNQFFAQGAWRGCQKIKWVKS